MGRPMNAPRVIDSGKTDAAGRPVYQMTGTLPNKKRVPTKLWVGLTKKEVEAKLKDLILAALVEEKEPRAKQHTWGEAADKYEQLYGPNQVTRYFKRARKEWENWKLCDIKGGLVRAWALEEWPGRKGNTLNTNAIMPVGRVINFAHEELDWCSPVRIKRFEFDERPIEAADASWISSFVTTAQGMGPKFVGIPEYQMFRAMTCVRGKHAMNLRWRDIDWEASTFTYRNKDGHLLTRKMTEGIPAMLRGLQKQKMKLLADPELDGRTRARLETDRVFGQNNQTGCDKLSKKVCDQAGIDWISGHRNGRAFFVTYCMEVLGLDEAQTAEAGDWKDLNSLRRYRKIRPRGIEVQAAIRKILTSAT